MNNIVEQLTSQDPLEAAKVAMGLKVSKGRIP